jgi:hypothetical protein
MQDSHYAALKDVEISARVFVSDLTDAKALGALVDALNRSSAVEQQAEAVVQSYRPQPHYGPPWSRPATMAP